MLRYPQKKREALIAIKALYIDIKAKLGYDKFMTISGKSFTNPLIVVLAGIVILVIGGVFYFGKPLVNRMVNPFVQNQTDLTADWKEYTNRTIGYSIKYPPDFKVDEYKGFVAFYKGEKLSIPKDSPADPYPTFSIGIYDRPTPGGNGREACYEEACQNIQNSPTRYREEKIKINNASGVNVKIIDPSAINIPRADYYLGSSQGNQVVRIVFSGYSELFSPEEQKEAVAFLKSIVATFKFTDPIANWKTYTNEELRFTMKYPEDWLFETKTTGGINSFLDIHLNNFQSSGSPAVCDKGFIGLELQVGIKKEANQDFGEFVNFQVSPRGLGLNPGGAIEQISVGNHRAFKVERSGWGSSCKGPGYFIEQDRTNYIYILTGSDVPTEGVEVFDQILSTFKFLNQ